MKIDGEDVSSLSLDDAALCADVLPGFLDELNEAELLSPSGIGSSSPLLSFVGCRHSLEAPSVQFLSTSPFTGLHTEAILQCVASADFRTEEVTSTKGIATIKSGVQRPPMQNSTRKRQKEELNYLRNKVQTMEQELEAKRQEIMALSGPDKENKTLTMQLSGRRGRATRWQRIAKHQLVEKQRAELQNLQLRASLIDQVKLSHSLQRLLKKNAVKHDEGSEAARLQARLEFSNCCNGESEDALYERLLWNMDAVYAEINTVCARHPVMQSNEEGSGVSSLHIGRTKALCLEATSARIVPFGMKKTCSAVWRCLSKECVKLADGTYHGVASSQDSIRAKAFTTLRVSSTAARIQMRFAMKRYVEPQRMVITLQSASESEGPRDLLHGLRMMQSAWVIIRPVPCEGDEDLASEETIIQLCMRLSPSLSATKLDIPGQCSGAITEILLAAVHRNLGWLFQTIENILMERELCSEMF